MTSNYGLFMGMYGVVDLGVTIMRGYDRDLYNTAIAGGVAGGCIKSITRINNPLVIGRGVAVGAAGMLIFESILSTIGYMGEKHSNFTTNYEQ